MTAGCVGFKLIYIKAGNPATVYFPFADVEAQVGEKMNRHTGGASRTGQALDYCWQASVVRAYFARKTTSLDTASVSDTLWSGLYGIVKCDTP
jgi:hypothetical protein